MANEWGIKLFSGNMNFVGLRRKMERIGAIPPGQGFSLSTQYPADGFPQHLKLPGRDRSSSLVGQDQRGLANGQARSGSCQQSAWANDTVYGGMYSMFAEGLSSPPSRMGPESSCAGG